MDTEGVYTNSNYTLGFIEDLQAQISKSIAKVSAQDVYSKKYDIEYLFDLADAAKLHNYWEILERIKHCDSCFGEYNIEEIISKTKKLINRLS